MKITDILRGKSAGKKTAVSEKSKQLYSLYDTCDKCPLRAYIEMMCNDNLKALVISGNPDEETLKKAKTDLLMEFSELCGNEHSLILSNTLKSMYLNKSYLQGFRLCIALVYEGKYNPVINYLKSIGINANEPKTGKDVDSLIKMIEGRSKDKARRLKEDQRKYESLNRGEVEKITPQFYYEQLAMLSRHTKFRIDTNITLSEYAAYLNDFKKYIKITQNGERI